ncbi:ADP-ribose pyrophosphatase [Fonticella tunisiensis]|uniref:ADP-ribose pyrophosphatase n=2 Tax=Fonticella tunisiensis TaxID=1096341 RepID=A0A4V3ES80_9CLOT|nr:ADP-ribose pyrophosphatase [Fonticella tunisiensis]
MKTRIKSVKPLAETKFLSLYDAEYTNKKGNTKHWAMASRKDKETLRAQIFEGKKEKIDAVVIAAVHRTLNKLVLVKQYRVPINDYIYELPAGLIDDGEEVFTAVERELMEETGLNLISIDNAKRPLPIYVSPGMTDESIALVYCLCDGEASTKYLEDDEDLEVILVSQEEAKKLLNEDVKFDVKAYLVLKSFAELGRDIVL